MIRALEAFLSEHSGDVCLIEIDSNVKQRISKTIIHRPEKTSQIPSNGSKVTKHCSQGLTSSTTSSSTLNAETISQVRSLLSQGYKIGTEHADKRRFRTKSWQSLPLLRTTVRYYCCSRSLFS
ncbi:ribulose bisphosphate carboxylase small subunit [cyanobacterium endosymbiont of Epithemia clementina EcSB]|uniref:ribulose bisphosphate carboxylase small subunit n=1 Tax=cyanobacterium endosymbiont of Epithemia clementina EcSB TaxID=3034674 RepID=UPI0024816F35|nr:ribulose bisphosphate carboxylase small subunit [cyanobacterium endosymbiont of Epithemia clementina EcSB]WGT67206.1 ribulose bisphosphate carboxylase small subunit [cyanobacterium endosymbiont of Epithemia clementina EcSB]